MKTLLEKAKSIKLAMQSTYKKHKVSNGDIEVVVAFLNGEVSFGQANQVVSFMKNKKGGSNYGRIVTILREGLRRDLVKIIYKDNPRIKDYNPNNF